MVKIIFALLFWSFAAAAPVGNTAAPEILQMGFLTPEGSSMSPRLSYEADFVTDARFWQYVQGDGRVDSYMQGSQTGVVTWNFVERLDLFGVFGESKVEANWRFINSATEQLSRIKLKSRGGFLWAVGARAILYEWGNLFLGTGGRYSASSNVVSRVTSDGIYNAPQGQITWRQWQVGVDISYKIQIFTPYIGTKYSYERSELSAFTIPIAADGTGSNTFKNHSPVGLYLGCTLSNGKFFALTIEGRVIDEEAVSVIADYRF